jgi:hypothetical protein
MSTISSIRFAHGILVFQAASECAASKTFAHALRTEREWVTAVEPRDLATASRLTLTLRRPRPDGAFLPICTIGAASRCGRPESTLKSQCGSRRLAPRRITDRLLKAKARAYWRFIVSRATAASNAHRV